MSSEWLLPERDGPIVPLRPVPVLVDDDAVDDRVVRDWHQVRSCK